MILLHIMWPAFAMVALIFTVLVTMATRRLGHIKRTPPTGENLSSRTAASRYFEPVDAAANNLANLFETPVLFFAIIPMLMVTQQAGIAQVLLAWIYVGLRVGHSWVHLGSNDLRPRLRLFLASVAVLSAMWIGFFIDFVMAAAAYQQAIGAALRP